MINRYENFKSEYVASRHVDVWLPNDLPAGVNIPTLYMHDGQNLFDPATAYGNVDWGIDETITRLMERGEVRGVIVIGVWNTSRRWREYMPSRPMKGHSARTRLDKFVAKEGGQPISDLYLKFLVEELKPFIDSQYPTLPDQSNTFIMGSSMGGLISAYALCEYPQVFGGAGCLSTHWPAGGLPLVEELGARLPPPGKHKLYFDYGTATLDADYEPYQKQMDALLRKKGYTPDLDWMTRKFDGAEHNEAAWRKRVHLPLEFLLGRNP